MNSNLEEFENCEISKYNRRLSYKFDLQTKIH